MGNTILQKSFSTTEIINLNFEKLLVLEGACQIIVEGQEHCLFQGDHIYIPTHVQYVYESTSNSLCKVLLEGNNHFNFKRILVFA